MSVYQVNKILYLTDNDAAFRKRMKQEPQSVLKEFRLSEDELAALTLLRGFDAKRRNFGRASSCIVKKVMSRLDQIVL